MNQEKMGKFIAQQRRKKNMTQIQLAEKLNVDNRTISRWENGYNMPDVSLFDKLCEELDITINELICGEKIETSELETKAEENIINVMVECKNKRRKLKRISMTFLILFIIIIFVLTIKNEQNKEENASLNESKNFVIMNLEQGNYLVSYRQNIVLNNLKELNLKQGEYINIYLIGKDDDEQELLVTNVLVGYDYENSSNSVVFFVSEEIYSTVKCVEYIAGDDYMVKVEIVENVDEPVSKLGVNINKILEGKCIVIEENSIEEDVKINY